MKVRPFWVVWNVDGPYAGMDAARFDTFDEADGEAQRRATNEHGSTFAILKLFGAIKLAHQIVAVPIGDSDTERTISSHGDKL